jgi:hypothetical protein
VSPIIHGYPALPGSHGRPGLVDLLVASGSTLLNGLVHYWTLEETSGTRSDSVGSLHLTDVNTVGYTASGKSGNAAFSDFPNSNEYLEAAAGGTYWNNNEMTILMWSQLFVDETDYIAGATNGWYIQYTAGSGVRIMVRVDGGNRNTAYNNNYTPGQWNCVGLRKDTTNGIQCFVNGVLGTAAGWTGTIDDFSGSPFKLFGYSSLETGQDSYIDEVAVWNRSLTDDEVTEWAAGYYPFA